MKLTTQIYIKVLQKSYLYLRIGLDDKNILRTILILKNPRFYL